MVWGGSNSKLTEKSPKIVKWTLVNWLSAGPNAGKLQGDHKKLTKTAVQTNKSTELVLEDYKALGSVD